MTPPLRIFFGKYAGTPVNELPSSYLIFLIEECDHSEWNIINASKQELSSRLKLDWSPDADHIYQLQEQVHNLKKQIASLKSQNDHLINAAFLCGITKANAIEAEQYVNSPGYTNSIINLIYSCQTHTTQTKPDSDIY